MGAHRLLVGTTVAVTIATGALLWTTRPDQPDDPVHAALCDAVDALAAGGRPREIYVERAHDPVHQLIDDLRAEDPAAGDAYADINETVETALDGHLRTRAPSSQVSPRPPEGQGSISELMTQGRARDRFSSAEMEVASAHLMVRSGTDGHGVLDRARDLLEERYGLVHATLQVEPDDHTGCDHVSW